MKKWVILAVLFVSFLYWFDFSSFKEFFNEDNLVNLLKEYGYIILFVWSIFEGETGLIMAGILSHTGDMNLWLAILVAALGGFIGDQIYFYLGRINKTWLLKELDAHRRKFAKARLLLRKYGGWVIFIQRFIYGMRTIIPMAIGVSGYDPRKYALINLISAFIWASVTIIPAYYFGEELLNILKWLKAHWYVGILFVLFLWGVLWYINKKEES
ncbi:MAG: DedA family protein [Nautiliaceae bacterium]|jgi:membrane protein DedA with SNARE-associated domain